MGFEDGSTEGIYGDMPAHLIYLKRVIGPQVKEASNVDWYFNDQNLSKTPDQHEAEEAQLRQEADQAKAANQLLDVLGNPVGPDGMAPFTPQMTAGGQGELGHGLGSMTSLDDFMSSYRKYTPGLSSNPQDYGYQPSPINLDPYNQKMSEAMSILDGFPKVPEEPALNQPSMWALAAAAIGAALTPEHAWDTLAAPFQYELGERAKNHQQLLRQYEQSVQLAQAKLGLSREQAQAYLNTAFQNAQSQNQALSQQAQQLFQSKLQNAELYNQAFLNYTNNAETWKRLDFSSKMEMAMTALRFGNEPSLPPEMRRNAAEFFRSITGKDMGGFYGKTPQNIAQELSNDIQRDQVKVLGATQQARVQVAQLQPDAIQSEIDANKARTAGQVIENQWKPRIYQSEIDLRNMQGQAMSAETDKTRAETGILGAGGMTIQQLQSLLGKYRDDERAARSAEKAPRIKLGEIERQIRDENKPGGWGPFSEKDADYEKRIRGLLDKDAEYQANLKAADEFKALADQAKAAADEVDSRIKGYKPNTSDMVGRVLDSATKFYNEPTKYAYGAEGKGNAYDCSSAICKIYSAAGIELPRTAAAQYSATEPVRSFKDIREGDLVFFRGTDPKHKGPNEISHVGMVYQIDPDGKIWMLHQSSSKNETVRVDLKKYVSGLRNQNFSVGRHKKLVGS